MNNYYRHIPPKSKRVAAHSSQPDTILMQLHPRGSAVSLKDVGDAPIYFFISNSDYNVVNFINLSDPRTCFILSLKAVAMAGIDSAPLKIQ